MTVKEAAQYLKLNYMTVYKLAQKARIPASKVGGAWRFKKDILDNWLSMQSYKPIGTVLIVDDDVRVREVLTDIVLEQGYKVVSVKNGQEAIEQLDRESFELVFLDLVLPDLSGVDILRKIKVKNRKTAVAIITGYKDDPIALEALALSPLVLIRKPFGIEDIKLVLGFITGYQPDKQYYSSNKSLGVSVDQ